MCDNCMHEHVNAFDFVIKNHDDSLHFPDRPSLLLHNSNKHSIEIRIFDNSQKKNSV